MHRNSIAFIACLLLCLSGFHSEGQIPKVPVSSLAYYQFQHIRDTTQAGKVWIEDFMLAFNEQQSVYLSKTKIVQDSTQLAILKKADEQNSNVINMGLYRPTTAGQVYVKGKKITLIKNFDGQIYKISDTPEQTLWQIANDTKTILGYTCQKATGTVKGRTYTVWFSTDVPAAFGPWKLFGLPGLILEAYDQSGRIKFTCTKVVLQAQIPPAVSLDVPTEAIETNDADYQRMEMAYHENLSTDAADADGIKVESVKQTSVKPKLPARKTSLNFPLELKK